jgi:hypothetical protein
MNSKFFNLNWADLGKGLLIAFLTALLGGILELLQAGQLPTTWVAFQPILEVSLSAAVAYLLKNLFTNSEGQLAKGEKSAAEFRAKRAGKLAILLPLFILLSASVSAQSPVKGFFTPVTAEQIQGTDGQRALTGTVLIRPEFTIAGNVIKPVFVDGKFNSFEVSFASRVGMGASYSLYKLVDGQPYNVYSFAAQLSLATIERPNMGLLLSASAFDLYGLSPSLGFGYDFVKDSPFKANYFFMWGVSHTFRLGLGYGQAEIPLHPLH